VERQLARAHYLEVVTAFDQALQQAPDGPQILNNKGSALQRLADLLVTLGQPGSACQAWGRRAGALRPLAPVAPRQDESRARIARLEGQRRQRGCDGAGGPAPSQGQDAG
jgi:hypothetical protein